jgi:hypothetical protein
MATVELPAGSFDLVSAFYSLIHVPKEDTQPYWPASGHGSDPAGIWS